MRITIGLLSVSVAFLGACASGNTTEGVRSDGLAVECEEEGDYQTCTPEDGDDECETWEDGGAAVVLWPPNHKLVRFTLDICAAPQDDCEEPTDDGSDGSDDGSDGSDGSDDGDDGSDDGDDGDDGSDDGGDVGVTVDRVLAGPTGAAPVEITSITADEDIDVGPGGDGHTTDFDMAIVDGVTFDLRSERQGGSDGRVYRVHYLDENGDAGSCEFLVPHDRGPHGGAIDSGTVVTLEP